MSPHKSALKFYLNPIEHGATLKFVGTFQFTIWELVWKLCNGWCCLTVSNNVEIIIFHHKEWSCIIVWDLQLAENWWRRLSIWLLRVCGGEVTEYFYNKDSCLLRPRGDWRHIIVWAATSVIPPSERPLRWTAAWKHSYNLLLNTAWLLKTAASWRLREGDIYCCILSWRLRALMSL